MRRRHDKHLAVFGLHPPQASLCAPQCPIRGIARRGATLRTFEGRLRSWAGGLPTDGYATTLAPTPDGRRSPKDGHVYVNTRLLPNPSTGIPPDAVRRHDLGAAAYAVWIRTFCRRVDPVLCTCRCLLNTAVAGDARPPFGIIARIVQPYRTVQSARLSRPPWPVKTG